MLIAIGLTVHLSKNSVNKISTFSPRQVYLAAD